MVHDRLKTFSLVVLYALGFYLLQYFLHDVGIAPTMPNQQNLLLWDANYYKSIQDTGYIYTSTACNAGFFPLASLVWKVLFLNVWGICILNILLFASGITLMCEIFPLKTGDKLLWLSMPIVFFTFIPYTEALFFFLTSLSFYGIIREKKLIVWLSLFFMALTRATAIFFIPTFIIMSLLIDQKRFWLKNIGYSIVQYIVPTILGLVVFIFYQYYATGVWFAYFKQQTNNWGRKFTIPSFPIHTFEGDRVIWLSALAMFVSLVAFLTIIKYLYNWLFKDKVQQDKLLIISFMYLIMSALSILFFNPKWGDGNTIAYGTHRYILMNPFFYVFLYYFTNKMIYTWKNYVYVFIIANLVWLSFGSYLHILHFLFYTFNTILIFIYMAYSNKNIEWPKYILIAISIFFQIHIFQQFISGLGTD